MEATFHLHQIVARRKSQMKDNPIQAKKRQAKQKCLLWFVQSRVTPLFYDFFISFFLCVVIPHFQSMVCNELTTRNWLLWCLVLLLFNVVCCFSPSKISRVLAVRVCVHARCVARCVHLRNFNK